MVFGALQLALAYCWTNLVAAELLAADSGLGFLITKMCIRDSFNSVDLPH